jgi:hypothetical protein
MDGDERSLLTVLHDFGIKDPLELRQALAAWKLGLTPDDFRLFRVIHTGNKGIADEFSFSNQTSAQRKVNDLMTKLNLDREQLKALAEWLGVIDQPFRHSGFWERKDKN